NLIKDEIFKLRAQGATVIFSTHRMESVEELCDHIALINKSEKILDGKKLDIKNDHKDGTFTVTHEGTLAGNEHFELLDTTQTETGLTQSTVKDRTLGGPNNLLKELINAVEIHSFIEKIPTINEIFISKVKGGDHE
ncbi:MAG: DUF4162 domain-containing protein, partial [Marinoscillum sp.]